MRPVSIAPTKPYFTRKAVALFDFKSSNDNELGFSKGDTIRLTDTPFDEHWWEGRSSKKKKKISSLFFSSLSLSYLSYILKRNATAKLAWHPSAS